MNGLVEILGNFRPSLNSLDLNYFKSLNVVRDKGNLVEFYVQNWVRQMRSLLEKCNFIDGLNMRDSQFNGVAFSDFDGMDDLEIDGAFSYANGDFFYEVKSQKLNGYSLKIPKVLERLNSTTIRPRGLIVFLPIIIYIFNSL